MLLKKTIGIIILVLNIAGFGFLLYTAGRILKDKFLSKNQIPNVQQALGKKEPAIANNDIILDEDDLLKDMDLSDLDDINFDDFD